MQRLPITRNALSWWEFPDKTVYAIVNKTTSDMTTTFSGGDTYGPSHCVLYRQQLP